MVEFLEENEVAIVLCSWLLGRNKCLWPRWRSTERVNKAIRDRVKPDEDFSEFDVHILFETDNYDKAREKLRKAENNTDLDTTDVDEDKRKRRPNTRYEDSDSEQCGTPHKRPRAAHPPENKSPYKLSREYTPKALEKCRDLPSTPYVSPPRRTPTSSTSKTTLFANVDASSSDKGTRQSANPSATEIRMLLLLEEIKTEVKLNRKLLLKLTKAERPIGMPTLPEGIKFPISSVEQLEDLDKKIRLSDETATALTTNLSLIGGENVESNVRRVMAHVLSQNVTLEYNWVGKGNKKAFQSLAIKRVITDAVRAGHSAASDNEIEKTMKDWLRYAKDREGGRRKRMEKKRTSTGEGNEQGQANEQDI